MRKAPRAADFAKRNDAAFAQAVITVHHNVIFEDPLDKAALRETADRWNEIYEVSAGLITLRNLADRELDRLRSNQDGLHGLGKSGLRQAIALLDALTTGTHHPIYNFIKGIQSQAFKAVRKKPNVIEKMDMDDLVGLVRALMKATGFKEAVAIKQIVDVCKLAPAEQWRRRIRDRNRRSKDGEPDKIAATLLRNPERIRERAANWAAQTFPIPPAPF